MGVKAEILLVDDHVLILEGVRRVLKQISDVVVADAVKTGREATELIAKRDYDAYVIDVGLPDVSGFDLIVQIRKLNKEARIIVCTMHEEMWSVKRLISLGINAIVLKASGTEEITNAVKSVLNGEPYTCPRFEKIHRELLRTSSDIHPKDVPTKREIEVLQGVAKGLNSIEIGLVMGITENTVETFRKRLIQKLAAKNATDMVVKAVKQGWIRLE